MFDAPDMHQTPTQQSTNSITKNRFLAALVHVDRYSGRFSGRLSRDTGISTTTLRRILRGEKEPSYGMALKLSNAITRFSNIDIPLNELIGEVDREFPTRYVCDLFRCKCLPPWAYGEDGALVNEFEGIPPGQWTLETNDTSATSTIP